MTDLEIFLNSLEDTELVSRTIDQIDFETAKRSYRLTCIRCKKLKNWQREFRHLCKECEDDLREKAESYGGESWEIGQRMKSYIAEVVKDIYGNRS